MKIKLYTAVAVLVLMPAPSAAVASPSPAEWPQVGYGAGNTNYNPDETRLNSGTIGKIRHRWTMRVKSSSSYCEIGRAPVLSGGRLFTTDPGGIGAYDPATGRRHWHVALPATSVVRLAAADGKLLALTSACQTPATYPGSLTALDPATGAQRWSIGLTTQTWDLRVDRGIAVLNSNEGEVGSTVAYRVADGRRAWFRKGERGDGLVSAGGRVLLRTPSGANAVSVTSGKVLWKIKGNAYAAGATPAGDRFYVSGTAGLSSVDAATGRARWTVERHVSDVVADPHRVCFAQYRSATCLDARTGAKLYSVHTPQAAGRPVRAGGLLYVVSGFPARPMTIADAATGRRLPDGMPGNQFHPPVVAGGYLYLTDGEMLKAYS